MKEEVIKFCKNKCCPVVKIKGDVIILGDELGDEGITTWNKQQFLDFLEVVKEGKFDHLYD